MTEPAMLLTMLRRNVDGIWVSLHIYFLIHHFTSSHRFHRAPPLLLPRNKNLFPFLCRRVVILDHTDKLHPVQPFLKYVRLEGICA